MKIEKKCSELLHKLIHKKVHERGKKYCGIKNELPPSYDSFGARYECLKKGVGVGKYHANDVVNQIIDELLFQVSLQN